HHGLARQAHLAVALQAQQLDLDHVAELDHVFDALDSVVVDLADVQQALGAGHDLDEGAEAHDALDLALVDLAGLWLRGEALDDLEGALDGLLIVAGHVDGAVVLHVDLATGGVDDALDGLAAGSDDDADLVWLDLDGGDARRPAVDLRTGLREGLQHL